MNENYQPGCKWQVAMCFLTVYTNRIQHTCIIYTLLHDSWELSQNIYSKNNKQYIYIYISCSTAASFLCSPIFSVPFVPTGRQRCGTRCAASACCNCWASKARRWSSAKSGASKSCGSWATEVMEQKMSYCKLSILSYTYKSRCLIGFEFCLTSI